MTKTKYYKLEGKNVVAVADVSEWAASDQQRTVAQDRIGDITISTVFLGKDYGFKQDCPLLFETMVFGGALDEGMERYCTYTEAEQGHKNMVALVKEGMNVTKNIAVDIARIQSQIQDADSTGEKRFLKGRLDALHIVANYMARYDETVELRTQYLRGVQHTLNDFFKEEENG